MREIKQTCENIKDIFQVRFIQMIRLFLRIFFNKRIFFFMFFFVFQKTWI